MPATPEPRADDVVAERAARWARQLVEDDLHRNTLVTFDPDRGVSVNLTQSDPEQLPDLLTGARKRLRPLFADTGAADLAVKRTRVLRRRLATLEEEQGFDAGRCAVGLLAMETGTARTALRVRAPLVLLPVTFTRAGRDDDVGLEIGADLEVNLVVLAVLQRQLGLDVDLDVVEQSLRRAATQSGDPLRAAREVHGLLDGIIRAAGHVSQYEEAVALGLFDYDKFPMVRDLQQAAPLLALHPVVRALAGDPLARGDLMAGAGESTGVPRQPPEDLVVLDADSSQQQAINAVLSGAHAVIIGPPGTGKSQTIANVIAGAAGLGRRVLFVAEKRAAIEAVTDRLASANLDGLVFDLHHQTIKKRDIARQLADTLDRARHEPPPRDGGVRARLIAMQREADVHAEVVNSRVSPWGLSPFEVQARLLDTGRAGVPSSRLRLGAASIERLSEQGHAAAVDDLRRLVNADGLRVRRGESPWARANVRTDQDVERVLAQLDRVQAGGLQAAQRELESIRRTTGLPEPSTLAQWQQLLALLAAVAQSLEEFGTDVFGADLEALVSATAPRSSAERTRAPMRFLERRRWRATARNRSRSGLRGPALHAGLVSARDQRNRWAAFSEDRSTPRDTPGLAQVLADFAQVRDALAGLAMDVDIRDPELLPRPELQQVLGDLEEDRGLFRQILPIRQAMHRLEDLGLADLLDELAERDASQGRVTADTAEQLLEVVWLSSLEQLFALRLAAYGHFVGTQHDDVVEQFRRADLEHVELNQQRVRRRVAERLLDALNKWPDQRMLVRTEAAKKSRHRAVRELVAAAPDVLLAAHPCWAMSPLVVSKLLPAEQLFDLVVFDEASQVEPQHAITSIIRGRQLVVAGDPLQLPPNRLFRRVVTLDDDAPLGDEDDDLEHFDSLLDVVDPLLPQAKLRWHYRSRDDRLIDFSNREIYGGALVTFAGCHVDRPLTLDVVDGRASPGGDGVVQAEVDRVVELVLAHARSDADRTLGVIAFGDKHADAIEGAILAARRDDPVLNDFLTDHDRPGRRLFVKNIERVQGDERDVVILSVGRPKTAAGRVSLNFGSLNHEGGERRLNVAVTRAKERMHVVSSFHPHDMPPDATKNRGPELLRRYLLCAWGAGPDEVGRSDRERQLNGFERAVLGALESEGIAVHPQWGVGEHAIDFALAHPTQPGRMVLAVEADGERYHRGAVARDRDRLRQEHLQRLGWRFVRIWSTAWFRDPDGQTQRVVAAWRDAVKLVDEPVVAPVVAPATPARPGGPITRRALRPTIPRRAGISEYTEAELVTLFHWLLSDGLLVDDEERLGEALTELGFSRMGSRIRERLSGALVRAREQGRAA